MKAKRFAQSLIVVGVAIGVIGSGVMAQEKPLSTSDTSTSTVSTPATPATFISFKNYPDQVFNVKEYINGMQKGGHNLLVWRDTVVNLSQFNSVKVTEFGGRLLPQQNVFSYDPYIALFNSVFRSSLKLPQKESPDSLLIEGAVVECNPGSRTARYLVGFGAGKAGCAVVCEVYEPGKPNPCIRIYTRDTGSMGAFGGDSVRMLNHILSELGVRVATTLDTTVGR
jgi:hypothetical protein